MAGSGPNGESPITAAKAKFYEITARGRRQLALEEQKWEHLTAAVATVLRFA